MLSTDKFIVRLLTFGLMLSFTSEPARSESDTDQCDAILKQDIFNKTINKTDTSDQFKEFATESFFNSSEESAFKQYSEAYDEENRNNISGKAEGNYKLIGGAVSFARSTEKKLTREQFSQEFAARKAEYFSSKTSSNERQASMIGSYTSLVRDDNTIKAWETCMTAKSEVPKIHAFGYRNGDQGTYIKVLWAPGLLGPVFPNIAIRFVSTTPNILVEGVGKDGGAVIAAGSGVAFALRMKDAEQRFPTSAFAIVINGELKNADQPVQALSAEAIVPAIPERIKVPPVAAGQMPSAPVSGQGSNGRQGGPPQISIPTHVQRPSQGGGRPPPPGQRDRDPAHGVDPSESRPAIVLRQPAQ